MKKSGKAEGGTGDSPEDALYQIPLSEFTPARNALVTRLKKGGKADEASRIKGLVKPSIPAWAVNQLFWHHRPDFDALIEIGDRFRKAQAAQLRGMPTDLRGPLEERREALSRLSKLAASALSGAGHPPSPDTMRRITSTLEALSVLGSSNDGHHPGRLIDDVDPPGFESLAALVPRVGGDELPGGPSKVLTFRQQQKQTETKAAPVAKADQLKAQVQAARGAVQDAERTLRAARKDAERAEEALKKAATHAKDADRARTDAEKQLEKASAAADQARQQARKTAGAAEDAAQAVEDAERALEKARQALENLS